MPYLGIKHIVGAEEWSSWAKAAWADELISKHGVDLEAAMAMIGDEQRQLPRSLSSYYFVQQLIDTGRFIPSDSSKRGGGGSAFPFSLIYNGLGYKNIKDWVGFKTDGDPKKNPIPANKLDAATDFMDFVCGNESKGIDPVIQDNREFKLFNKIAADRESLAALKKGESLEKVARRLDPLENQLLEGLVDTKRILAELVSVAASKPMTGEEARNLLPPAESVVRLSRTLYQRIATAELNLDLRGIDTTDDGERSKSKPKK